MSSATQTVRVDLAERGYDIEIGSGNLPQAGPFLTDRGKVSHAVLITDENVQEPHALRVAESLSGRKVAVDLVAIKPGEPSKSIDVAASLWEGMLQLNADRRTVVVAVGGGVVGDLAGFVAATFARGLRFLQIPTTLLAQVDSSVGGKVGINLPEAKNMVGAFHQPLGVLIDTATLDTLPPREYRAGLGEVVKYGVILDAELFDYLEAHVAELLARDPLVLTHVIAQCCRLKAGVVGRDEREETGQRAVLNYGHSFAHALESLCGYGQLLHGEAVAIGMECAARLAEQTWPRRCVVCRSAAGAAGRPRPAGAIAQARPSEDRLRDDARQEGAARAFAAGIARPAGPRGVGRRCSRRGGPQGPGAVAARNTIRRFPRRRGRR